MSKKKKLFGFGYDPDDTTQHFVVFHPAGRAITLEHRINGLHRVVARLSWLAWSEIAQPVAAEFNRQLNKEDIAYGRWRGEQTTVRHTFGKELLLLFWAMEDAPIERIPRILDYWRGLHPCERWWLCTQANATLGAPEHAPGRGWRMAVKYALGAMEED